MDCAAGTMPHINDTVASTAMQFLLLNNFVWSISLQVIFDEIHDYDFPSLYYHRLDAALRI